MPILGTIYSQIGNLLSFQRLDSIALENYIKAYKVSKFNKDTVTMIYNIRDIGESYWNFESIDTALIYYRKAESLAKEQGSKRMFANVNRRLVTLFIQIGDMKAAEEALRKSQVYYDEHDISPTLSISSLFYSKSGKTDSAYICNIKLLEKGNVYGKLGAYAYLTDYYLKRNERAKAIECFSEYQRYNDSVMRITAADEMAKSHSMYNYKLREKENYELKLKQKNDRVRLVLLGSVCVVLGLVVVFLLMRKKMLNELTRFKKERLRQIKAEAVNDKTARERQEGKMEEIDVLKTINKIIGEYPAKQTMMTDVEWNQLDKEINNVFPNFGKKVRGLCQMSAHEYRVCMLIKVKISPSNIALLTNHSKEAITSVRRRLFFKAFGEKGSPSDWDKIILSL